MENLHGSTKPDRKTIEKNRRIHMKSLCAQLESLLPTLPHARAGMTVRLQDQIDEAVAYIKGLQESIEGMKGRKRQLMRRISSTQGGQGFCWLRSSPPPKFEVQDLGAGGTKIVVTSTAGDQAVFYNVVEALEEEGMQIVGANYSVMGDQALHIIHAYASATGARQMEPHKLMEILVNKATHVNI